VTGGEERKDLSVFLYPLVVIRRRPTERASIGKEPADADKPAAVRGAFVTCE
jgi:hypothetical protein